jgi:hypothetical protein
MTTFLYRCPATGRNVQGFVVDSAAVSDDSVYEAVTCALCRRVHLVNPKNSRVIASNLSSEDRTRVRVAAPGKATR